MEFWRVLIAGVLVSWVFSVGNGANLPPCEFPAIYNFGDSNSDTGGISAAFEPIRAPYGVSYFHKPSGRDSDGRLIIDFIAERVKLPYLHAYLNSLGANFRNGANFATGGSTIRRQNETIYEYGISPFALDMQIVQFKQFKERSTEMYKRAKDPSEEDKLPRPEDFAKALYTFDIGQNDLSVGFRKMSFDQLRAAMPDIINQLASAVQQLYEQGGRTFWIHNTGPIGCLPVNFFYILKPEPGYVDQYGCVKAQNEMATEFNRQLKERIIKLRTELPGASITYVDVYTAKISMISNAKKLGMADPLKVCCGYHVNYDHIWCGNKGTINKTEVYGASCENPAVFVSWDGVHYTQTANQFVADHTLNGSFLGAGIGFGNQAVPLYLSEMAPAKYRGAVNQLFQLTTCLGILIASAINYGTEKIHPWGWRLSLGLATVPATVMFVGGLCLPETPNSLVEQGRLEEAKRVLVKVRGTPNVDNEFADLIEASDAARAIKHPFRNLLQRKNRPQLVLGALGIPAFQQLTGMNSILFYAPVFFQTLGFGSGASLFSSLITNGALVLATLISMALVDKFGRRAFFLEAGVEMFCCMVALAITLALKFGEGKALPVGVGWFLVSIIFLFVLAYGRSWGPLGWLVPSELFPLETRSAGQSMVVSVNLLFTALIAQCFLVSLCHLRYGIFLLFAGLIFIMSSFIYFLLPETKQVPIEEVYLLWKDHWFWKKYVEDDERYQSEKPATV